MDLFFRERGSSRGQKIAVATYLKRHGVVFIQTFY
jgi:hypothetical protein